MNEADGRADRAASVYRGATFTDPFGLMPDTVWIGIRQLGGILGPLGNHAAVRVNDQIGELLQEDANFLGFGGWNRIDVRSANASEIARYTWIKIDAPSGMSSEKFDAAVVRSFNANARAVAGHDYRPSGWANSNRFIFDVVRGAGGSIPGSATEAGGGWLTPGICGHSPNPGGAGGSC